MNQPDWPKLTGLRFAPYAWAKLLHMIHAGDVEVAGFGITKPDDFLLITDFQTVKQESTMASFEFDDIALADYVMDHAEQGRNPEEVTRIWIHTHPGDGCQPSGTDEATCKEVLGKCDWGVMAIVSRTHKGFARLVFNVGPGGEQEIPVSVDWSAIDGKTLDKAAWQAEYEANVKRKPVMASVRTPFYRGGNAYKWHWWDEQDGISYYGKHSTAQAVVAPEPPKLVLPASAQQAPTVPTVSEDVATGLASDVVMAVETMMAKDHGKIHTRGTKDWWAMAAPYWETIRESAEQAALLAKDEPVDDWPDADALRKELTGFAAKHLVMAMPEDYTTGWWDVYDDYMEYQRLLQEAK